MILRRTIKMLLPILVLLTIAVSLNCIESQPGSGRDVSASSNLTRERDFFYHNNTDDQHWYGTNKWAVRFDFADIYPTYSTSNFVLNKVKAYFPITPSPITAVSVAIHADGITAPGSVISTTSIDSVSDWIEFSLTNPDTLSSCWMVVTCSTSVTGPYISASMGGGLHSYYWNTNLPVEYFQNMYTAGIFSEFLFSAVGRFELSNVDLELQAFDLKPEITMGREVFPEFSIYNNSDSLIANPTITMTVSSPNPEFALQDTIIISRTIAPNSSLFVPYDDPDYQDYGFSLPDYPIQFKIRAFLHSEFDVADTLFNNSVTRYYNSFAEDMPFTFVENFIQSEQAQSFLMVQDVINSIDTKPVNYFPLITDPYYQPGSVQRFNWYSFAGQPMTAIGGDDYITGFLPSSYENQYSAAIDEVNLQKTFLTQNEVSLSLPSPYSNIQVRVTLRNPETYVFSDNIEPSSIRQSRFYAALCRKINLFDLERYTFIKWAAYQDTIATAIPMGEAWLKQFSFSVSEIGLDSLLTDYDLIYWVQHNTSKQILFSNVISLNQIVVTNEDENLPVTPVKITLSPNPVRAGRDILLTITGPTDKNAIGYEIYNIKGQLVSKGTLDYVKEHETISTNEIKAAGLYIIRFDIRDKSRPGSKISQIRKIIVY